MTTLMVIGFVLVGSCWLLWVFFLAVMSLKRAKQAGTLSRTALFFGTPVLWIGYLLDAFVNATFMTIVLLEIPRWPHETLVSDRLKRHHQTSTGWRLSVVLWFEPLLDPYDPSGDHI